MRQVQLAEEEKQFASLVSEAEAGTSLTILRAGKPVAQIIPFPQPDVATAERQQALIHLRAIMEHGYDLGGLKIGNRDQLYDRN